MNPPLYRCTKPQSGPNLQEAIMTPRKKTNEPRLSSQLETLLGHISIFPFIFTGQQSIIRGCGLLIEWASMMSGTGTSKWINVYRVYKAWPISDILFVCLGQYQLSEASCCSVRLKDYGWFRGWRIRNAVRTARDRSITKRRHSRANQLQMVHSTYVGVKMQR